MTPFIAWGVQTLVATTILMLLVLLMRAPVRRAIGPRLAYLLWALPVLRLVMPSLPVEPDAAMPLAGTTGRMIVLAVGAPGDAALQPGGAGVAAIALLIWGIGALVLLSVFAVRHARFCARLRATGVEFASRDSIHVIAADVEGPVAFGVLRWFIAVPRDFATLYTAREQELALAHERAHHVKGDLIANWIALLVLAAHWWNPVAWIAHAAFQEDQEFAADAHVLASAEASALAPYAALLAKVAGVSAPPACGLNARSNLKGRLMMLDQHPRSLRRIMTVGALTALLGGTALAATAIAPVEPSHGGKQAVTIAVKPDGAGAYSLIVDGVAAASGTPLPHGLTLPADFSAAASCDLGAAAKPTAIAIKGSGGVETYTVICASAAAATVPATLREGLASLKTMRMSVATQPASAAFPEAERAHALAAIDRSIRDVEQALARLG